MRSTTVVLISWRTRSAIPAAAIVGLIWASAAGRADAQEGVRRLESELAPIRKKYKLPALAGAIVSRDGLQAIGAVGLRAVGSDEKVTSDDLFHIGSCTKSMTATLIGILVERGKLSWKTTIADVFPDMAESMHADYRGVTIRQLLGHRAGMPSDLSAGGLWGRLRRHTGPPIEQRRTLFEGVIRKPPASKPGAKFLYSNAGYAIAGHMAEKVTGVDWESLMRRELFRPLGMTTAGFGAPGTPDAIDQPRGHRSRDGRLVPVTPGKNADNPAAIGPAGTVRCSLADWAKFVRIHLGGGDKQRALITAETLRTLHEPLADQVYALGWNVARRPWGGRVLTHAGSNTMWFCVVWASPEKGFAVMAATNTASDGAREACDKASWALIQRWQTMSREAKP